MNRIERLAQSVGRHVALPWDHTLAGAQKVWFGIYDKMEERRLRARVTEFEIATKREGHSWILHDLTNAFPRWMAAQEYRDSYFESPEDLDLSLPSFVECVCDELRTVLESPEAGRDTVVAVLGVGALFGFAQVSKVVVSVQGAIRGRLLVFFPGTYESNAYYLLDARRGWDYLAVPITAHDVAATDSTI